MEIDKERAIRAIVQASVTAYAAGFADRHISEKDDAEGTINMKIHNVFIAALGSEIQYYSALLRSLDSSLGNMLEKMAISIAKLHYDVRQYVEGSISKEQTEYIADILEAYKSHRKMPEKADYEGISERFKDEGAVRKRHESDYYLHDPETHTHYVIELKIGGDLDNKKARSEKEALLEQYCILSNSLGAEENIKICFATAYNRYGEGNSWEQTRVRQFFANDELLISKDFWNMICKSEHGYDIVLDEYRKNAHVIVEALNRIKAVYLQG